MKEVRKALKAKESRRAGKEWDLTSKVCREGEEIIKRKEMSEEEGNWMKPKNCHAPKI